ARREEQGILCLRRLRGWLHVGGTEDRPAGGVGSLVLLRRHRGAGREVVAVGLAARGSGGEDAVRIEALRAVRGGVRAGPLDPAHLELLVGEAAVVAGPAPR